MTCLDNIGFLDKKMIWKFTVTTIKTKKLQTRGKTYETPLPKKTLAYAVLLLQSYVSR